MGTRAFQVITSMVSTRNFKPWEAPWGTVNCWAIYVQDKNNKYPRPLELFRYPKLDGDLPVTMNGVLEATSIISPGQIDYSLQSGHQQRHLCTYAAANGCPTSFPTNAEMNAHARECIDVRGPKRSNYPCACIAINLSPEVLSVFSTASVRCAKNASALKRLSTGTSTARPASRARSSVKTI
ncbi:hypothetical protein BST61_g5541 [Cercospora zeina]